MTAFLDALRKFIETVAPALAVALWDYEEDKADAAIKAKEAAELVAKNLTDEKNIRAQFASSSDSDTINTLLGDPNATSPAEPTKPKPGGGA